MRAQIHVSPAGTRVFSRACEDRTASFPDAVREVEAALGVACFASAGLALVMQAPLIALLPTIAGIGLLTFAWRTVSP